MKSETLPKDIVGLDISDNALRVVALQKIATKISLRTYGSIAVPAGVIQQGTITKPDEFKELVKKLFATANGQAIRTKNVIAVLPEPKTFITMITIEKPENEELLEEAILEGTKKQIPLDFENLYLDWQLLDSEGPTASALVGAVPKETSDQYYDLLHESELLPFALEIEAAAIHRSLIADDDPTPRLIIDFGAARTSLIATSGGYIHFTTSLPISGRQITAEIATKLKIDETKAEKAKKVCGLNEKKCEGALRTVLSKMITNLARQIEKSITFHNGQVPAELAIKEIVLCGGGANFEHIDRVLKQKLNLPVLIGNPALKLNMSKKLEIPKSSLLSYTTAIGLALRPYQKD